MRIAELILRSEGLAWKGKPRANATGTVERRVKYATLRQVLRPHINELGEIRTLLNVIEDNKQTEV
jgi:hypothetical protein